MLIYNLIIITILFFDRENFRITNKPSFFMLTLIL